MAPKQQQGTHGHERDTLRYRAATEAGRDTDAQPGGDQRKLRVVLAREMGTGVLLGIILGSIALGRILLWPARQATYGDHYARIAAAVHAEFASRSRCLRSIRSSRGSSRSATPRA